MNMTYIEAGKALIKKIEKYGFEAYFVGGVVRDKLLGIEINDIDITTSASSDELIMLFDNTDTKGLKYKSVLIKYKGYEFETTTFRVDSNYLDNRHPSVKTALNLEEDLKRRDFTINAFATTDFTKIIDNYGGLEDLENNLIKTIKNPLVSFNEDSLRILRAIYFSAKLDFKIEKETFLAILEKKDLVSNLSPARKTSEIAKILKLNLEAQKRAYLLMNQTSISKILFLDSAVTALLNSSAHVTDSKIFYSLAFRDYGYIPKETYQFSKKFSNEVDKIIDLSIATENEDFNTLLLYNYGEEICLYANIVNMILGKNKDLREEISANYKNLPIKKTCDLKFKGQDVMELCKLDKVSEISIIVDKVKFAVLNRDLPNDYEILKKYVLNDLKKGD